MERERRRGKTLRSVTGIRAGQLRPNACNKIRELKNRVREGKQVGLCMQQLMAACQDLAREAVLVMTDVMTVYIDM